MLEKGPNNTGHNDFHGNSFPNISLLPIAASVMQYHDLSPQCLSWTKIHYNQQMVLHMNRDFEVYIVVYASALLET